MQMRQVEIYRETERCRIEVENELRRIEMGNDCRQAKMQHNLELAKLNAANATVASVPNSAGSDASSSGNK